MNDIALTDDEVIAGFEGVAEKLAEPHKESYFAFSRRWDLLDSWDLVYAFPNAADDLKSTLAYVIKQIRDVNPMLLNYIARIHVFGADDPQLENLKRSWQEHSAARFLYSSPGGEKPQ